MDSLRAIIYSRVSTNMQEEAASLVYQIKKCEDFCKLKGYEIYKVIEDVESGANDSRFGFLELQKEIQLKTFDILIVYESSRLSRRTITLLNFVLQLDRNNIKFTSISQPELDTTTHTGMLFFQIQASLGEYERKQISSRVKSSKWARIKDGKWQGGNMPLGYSKYKDNITVIEDEANIVRAMYQYYLESQSLSKTAMHFNRKISSVRWILSNHFYLGKLTFGRQEKNINTGKRKRNSEYQVFDANHPAIISKEVFEKVQDIFESKRRITESSDTLKLLFTGILKCTCGGSMYRNKRIDKKKNLKKINYCCDKCGKSWAYRIAEGAIIEELLNMDEILKLDSKIVIKDPNLAKQLEVCDETILKCQKSRERIIKLFSNERISISELDNQMEEIKLKKEIAVEEKKKLEDLIGFQQQSENYTTNLQLLKDVLENMDEENDREELHKVFRLLIKEIRFISRKPLKLEIIIK